MIETYQKTSEVGGQTVYKTYAKVSDLHEDPNNPRDITDEKAGNLVEFLSKYGSFKPSLVDFREEKMGNLIGGNKRFAAYQKMGIDEIWIEPRVPGNDAEAFEMATIDNMEFGHYVEEKLKAEILKHQDELGDDIAKLEAALKLPDSFGSVLKSKELGKAKFEIVIRCMDENDMREKFQKISELGIPAKAK